MGMDIDAIIKNEKIKEVNIGLPLVMGYITIRSATSDVRRDFENLIFYKLLAPIYETTDDGTLIDLLDTDSNIKKYKNLQMEGYYDSILKEPYPKFIKKFITNCKENNYKLGYCTRESKLFALGDIQDNICKIPEYDVASKNEIYDYKFYDSELDQAFLLRDVRERLSSIYGISLSPVFFSYEEFNDSNFVNKKRNNDEFLEHFTRADRSKKLAKLMQTAFFQNVEQFEKDVEYHRYYYFIMNNLDKGFSFIYSY